MKLDVSFNLMLVKIILVFKLFFVSIACKLAMTLEWLMYLVVHQNLVMSGNGVSTWSVECDNCKCCMDVLLTFPVLFCVSKALSESHLHIYSLVLYLISNVVVGV